MWTIFGAHGWIGGKFIQLLQDNKITYDAPFLRLDDMEQVRRYLQEKKPERVISLIGRTHGGSCNTIDYLESGRAQLRENVRDNLFAPVAAALLCKDMGIHFTYLGTGCIFTYDSSHTLTNGNGFSEEDDPNFFGSAYSIVKGYTDRLMRLLDGHVLQLRIRMPISDDVSHPRNFITKILTYSKICSVPNSMTVLPEILPIMIDMIKNKTTGTFNMTNPGTISHNAILDMYKTTIDPTFTYSNFSIEEQSQVLKAERSNNLLDTSKLENRYFILPIHQSVQRLLKKVRKDMLHSEPYSPKRVMVTGGFGFIGSNFIHLLRQNKAIERIVNVDKLLYCGRKEHLDGIDRIDVVADINNTEKMMELLKTHEIDTVVHFAAQSHVDNSFGNSISFTMDNARGTHSLLEACRQIQGLKRFLYISTDEVYGENLSNEGFRETELTNPTNPYAATKAGAEKIVQSYYHCFELPVIIARGNNVFGPRQFPEKVIPKFIMQVLNNRKCTVAGNGMTRRNFIYVDDFCAAVDLLLRKGEINEIYNIGSNDEHSVMDIARAVLYIHKGASTDLLENIEHIPDRFFNDFTYRINCDKLKALGWAPKMTFEQGLRLTFDYYRRFGNLYKEALIGL